MSECGAIYNHGCVMGDRCKREHGHRGKHGDTVIDSLETTGAPEWQEVQTGRVYVMVSKDKWERESEKPRRAIEILRGNQRPDGSVSGAMVNDVLGILEGRW